jgi:transcriptional regulator with GAF, ATPase, and Fis domain
MFGHVRGPGPTRWDRKGRFELADGGTSSSTIGDPVGLQVKTRGPDRTHEMLGSSVTRIVDVRVISPRT